MSDEQTDPHVYCTCGAQWHGRYASAENIMRHEGQPGCVFITEAQFIALHHEPTLKRESAETETP